MLNEIRVAVRALARRPGFAATALLTIAIAVGANTAIFSVVRGVLLSALPFHHPDELVTLDVRSSQGFLISTSVPNYRDWTAQNRTLASTAAVSGWGMTANGTGPATVLSLQVVLGDFFRTLGLEPQAGRVFSAAETEQGQEAVVVLGHQYWKTAYAGDLGVVGRTILLDARPYVVVGILKEGHGYPTPDVNAYVPLGTIPGLPWDDRRSSFGLRVVGRLGSKDGNAPNAGRQPGVEEARLDLKRVGEEVRAANTPDTALPEVRSFSDFFVGNIRTTLWLLMGAVSLVLLIAAANVANLLLARAEERRQEMAVRTALGADRGRLVRQTLIESLVLAVTGGVIGIAGAGAMLKLLLSLFAGSLPAVALPRIHLDGTVLLFSLALALTTGVAFGILPSLKASAVNLSQALRQTSLMRGDGVRSALVVSEMALAVVLLIGAGLMLKTIDRLRTSDKGFDAANVLSARVRLPRPAYADSARWNAFYTGLLDRLSTAPGVTSVAFTQLIPLSQRSNERGIWPEGVAATPGTGTSVLFNVVSPAYFTTLGVDLVAGRAFAETDRAGAPLVAIIDQTMAERFWPGEDAVGKRVTFEGAHGGDPVYRTVVGVAKNVRHYDLANPSRIQVYVPWTQRGMIGNPDLSVLVRTAGEPMTQATTLQGIVATLDRDVPVTNVQPMTDYVEGGLSTSRALGDLLATFAAVALALSGVGIFGVMSYTVAQRTREIGVRMAVGATRTQVLQWVTGRALRLALGGALIGVVAATALTRLLRNMLYQVSPLDPVTFAGVTILLVAAALLAAVVPARRATSVDPTEALRS